MKKLKLIGIRKWWFIEIKRNVADVYVKDGKVIVESKNPKIREQLQTEIDKYAYQGIFTLRLEEEDRDEKGKVIERRHIMISKKPGDERFLDALRSAHWLWDTIRFNGYEIYETISKVVEE